MSFKKLINEDYTNNGYNQVKYKVNNIKKIKYFILNYQYNMILFAIILKIKKIFF
jgi:hypothetical protein